MSVAVSIATIWRSVSSLKATCICKMACSIAEALCSCLVCIHQRSFTVVAQLTLALLPPGPHLFWLCFFAVLGVLVASTVRVATDMGTGIVTGLPARAQVITHC